MPQLDPRIGEIYRYYKGGMVQINGFATHTQTGERLVVYQELFGRFAVFASPFSRFVGQLDFKKHPTCPDRFRFTFVSDPSLSVSTSSAPVQGEVEEASLVPRADQPMTAGQSGVGQSMVVTGTAHVPQQSSGQGMPTTPTVETGRPHPANENPMADKNHQQPVNEESISDLMLAFLDERDFEKKEEILSEMATRPDLNDNIIDNLAAALDVVIDEGPLDRRFTQLRFCVRTRARFENTRLR
ncbi:MAG: DUF1653 domain-containing protein [Lachnospiraceae bacterium]|nr:DUF1653 domain-containing protein [Lachnospiraceae bacterium]